MSDACAGCAAAAVVVGCCSSCKTVKKGFPFGLGLSLHLSVGEAEQQREKEREGGRKVYALLSLCSSAFAHSFHLRSFPTFPLLPSLPACVLRLALLFFLHIPTRKIHRARCDDVGIKTPATHFVAHKFNSLRPVCVLCPAWHVATLRRCCSSCGRQVR